MLSLAFALLLFPQQQPPQALVKELWDKVTLTFTQDTPYREDVGIFQHRRLDVTFVHSTSGTTRKIPGYFAADGNAAETGTDKGTKWRVHWTPEETGTWTWTTSFKQGTNIAADPWATGTSIDFDGYAGSITVNATSKSTPDFRARGLLQYDSSTGANKFKGDSTYFYKVGCGSPENWLAFPDFDNTNPVPPPHGDGSTHRHDWSTHTASWRTGDPVWQSTKGKGIIGSLNYLAGYDESTPPVLDSPRRGVNSMYVMLMNVAGDGQDVWPFAAGTNAEIVTNANNEQQTYDCSKLDQWQIVFDHAQELGIHLTFYLGEKENINLLGHMKDGLQIEGKRKIYYREMMARFGYLNAITWVITEEWPHKDDQGNSPDRLEDVWRIWGVDGNGTNRPLDPYGHPIIVHLEAGASLAIDTYAEQVTRGNFHGVGIQITGYQSTTSNIRSNAHRLAEDWYDDQYTDIGGTSVRPREIPWNRTIEETGPVRAGILKDGEGSEGDGTHGHQTDHLKKDLWVAACAGGVGHMSYLGCVDFPSPVAVTDDCEDVNLDDFEDWDSWWGRTYLCYDFMNKNVPFQVMEYREDLRNGNGFSDEQFHLMASYTTSGTADGEYYMCFFEEGVDVTSGGDSATLDFESYTHTYDAYWINVEDDNDGTLPGAGSRKTTVTGAGVTTLPTPPSGGSDSETDAWVLFLDKQ